MGNESKNKKKNDNKLDIVKESFENGLTYEGELKDGEWCGQGILISHYFVKYAYVPIILNFVVLYTFFSSFNIMYICFEIFGHWEKYFTLYKQILVINYHFSR